LFYWSGNKYNFILQPLYHVCNALIKANKDFELVVLPGSGHTMGNDYGENKRYDFFVKNLMGVMPPGWSEVGVKK